MAVLIQILLHEPIVRVMQAAAIGEAPVPADKLLAWLHVGIGSIIFCALIARLYLRFTHGVPADAGSSQQAKAASIVHMAFYWLLIAMFITGILTWNNIAPLGSAHFITNAILFFLIIGHILAVIFNHLVRKQKVMKRMLPARFNSHRKNTPVE